MKKLHSVRFGLAFGFVMALYVFCMGMVAHLYGLGVELVKLSSTVYIGYAPTVIGSATGAMWAFAEGFIFRFLIAVFYNLFCRCCRKADKCHCKCCADPTCHTEKMA